MKTPFFLTVAVFAALVLCAGCGPKPAPETAPSPAAAPAAPGVASKPTPDPRAEVPPPGQPRPVPIK